MSLWSKWHGKTEPRSRRRNRALPSSRRAFLGGAGVVLALPFFESLLPIRGRQAFGAVPGSTKRLVYFYTPNGFWMPEFIPNNEGLGYDLPDILTPLADVQDSVSVLSGMVRAPTYVNVGGAHARGTAGFLTCQTIRKTAGADILNGISVDQVAAQATEGTTRFPSIQLGTDGYAICDSGYACIYTAEVSWSNATTPLSKQIDPGAAFDRLFDGFDETESSEVRDRRNRIKSSILDVTLEESNLLRGRLGRTDQRKLDEYLTGVRELEQLVTDDDAGTCEPGTRPSGGDIRADSKAMIDLMVVAMQCDVSRIFTFMLENGASHYGFNFLGIPEAHHSLSHHREIASSDAERAIVTQKLVDIGNWEVSQFAYLVEQLKNFNDESGPLLDSTLAMMSSECGDGNTHDQFNLPVLLAGAGGGWHRPGRHIRMDDGKMADLYLSMLHGFGVENDTFGADGTEPMDLT